MVRLKVLRSVWHGVSQSIRHPRQIIVFNHDRHPDSPAKMNPLPWQAAIGVFVFSVVMLVVGLKCGMPELAELMKITTSLSFGYLFGMATGVLHK